MDRTGSDLLRVPFHTNRGMREGTRLSFCRCASEISAAAGHGGRRPWRAISSGGQPSGRELGGGGGPMGTHVAKQAGNGTGRPAVADPILASKITVPDVPGFAVQRPRISELLAGGTRWNPLTVVTGPPGT